MIEEQCRWTRWLTLGLSVVASLLVLVPVPVQRQRHPFRRHLVSGGLCRRPRRKPDPASWQRVARARRAGVHLDHPVTLSAEAQSKKLIYLLRRYQHPKVSHRGPPPD